MRLRPCNIEAMQGENRGIMLLMILVALASARAAVATKHVVGGSQGWDLSTDLDSWASSTTFRIGDQLVFKYAQGLHSVVELAGEKEYNNCEMGGAVESMSSGRSRVKLTKAGQRYFACGTLGHCQEGMRVKIKTLAANETASQGSSPTSAATHFTHFNVYYFFVLLLLVNLNFL